jgi:hypothetical protein
MASKRDRKTWQVRMTEQIEQRELLPRLGQRAAELMDEIRALQLLRRPRGFWAQMFVF